MWARLWDWSEKLRADQHQGRLRQWRRLLQARRIAGIEASEFYEFEIFDRERFTDLERCVGRRAGERIDALLNDTTWQATVNDKILHYALLEHHGVPTARTQAIYGAGRAGIGDEQQLADAEQLHRFLARDAVYALFIKPVGNGNGRGTFAAVKYDAKSRTLVGPRGNTAHLADVVAAGARKEHRGLLLQHMLEPHPTVRKACGPATSSVCLLVARAPDGAFVHRAYWHIARLHHITDRFERGQQGNLLANVAVANGRVTRVVGGVWPDSQPLVHHPDTHERLLGLRLPDWTKAVARTLKASELFPRLRLQAWDVALCADGPTMLKCNVAADLELSQLLDGRPFIDDRLLAVLKANGWPPGR